MSRSNLACRRIALLVLLWCTQAALLPVDQVDAAVSEDEDDELGPEKALHTFLLAMLARDEERLATAMLAHEDSAVLLTGDDPPKRAIRQFEALSKNLKTVFTRVQVGETIRLPGAKSLEITDRLVNDKRVMIMMRNAPLPFTVERKKGRWRVDASPIIAARKAAIAARTSPSK